MKDIGGFFATLTLKTDGKSFGNALKELQGVGKELKGIEGGKGFMKAFTGVLGVTTAVAAATAAIVDFGSHTADKFARLTGEAIKLGVGLKKIDDLELGAKTAGITPDQVEGVAEKIVQVTRDPLTGKVDTDYLKNLGMSGVNVAKFLDSKTSNLDKVDMVMEALQRKIESSDKRTSAQGWALADNLGITDIMTQLETFKVQWSSLASTGAGINPRKESDYADAVKYAAAMKKMGTQFETEIDSVGLGITQKLVGPLQNLSTVLGKLNLEGLGGLLGGVAGTVINFLAGIIALLSGKWGDAMKDFSLLVNDSGAHAKAYETQGFDKSHAKAAGDMTWNGGDRDLYSEKSAFAINKLSIATTEDLTSDVDRGITNQKDVTALVPMMNVLKGAMTTDIVSTMLRDLHNKTYDSNGLSALADKISASLEKAKIHAPISVTLNTGPKGVIYSANIIGENGKTTNAVLVSAGGN